MGFRNKLKNQSGFTLLEVLVVISIFTLLVSATTTTAGNSARAEARDAKRKADFRNFATGLDLYFSVHNLYPCGDANRPGKTVDSTASDSFLNGGAVGCPSPNLGLIWAGIIKSGTNLKDPLNRTGHYYLYEITLNRQYYILATPLERDDELMESDGGVCDNLYEIGTGLGLVTPLNYSHSTGMTCN